MRVLLSPGLELDVLDEDAINGELELVDDAHDGGVEAVGADLSGERIWALAPTSGTPLRCGCRTWLLVMGWRDSPCFLLLQLLRSLYSFEPVLSCLQALPQFAVCEQTTPLLKI